MTNAATTSTQTVSRSFARPEEKHSDEAPMVVTRLSGWIDSSEVKFNTPNWIVPTRVQTRAR